MKYLNLGSILIGIFFVFGLSVSPHIASAETVFRYGTDVSLAADQAIDGDLYSFGGQWWSPGEVSLSGSVSGDVYGFGNHVVINGSVGSDVSIAGINVQIHGAIGDDIRVIGEKVVIADSVEGDLFVVAGTLTILSSADVSGNIYFYGSSADISGNVGGSIHGAADEWRIDSSVSGDVEINASHEIVLGARASVLGDVTYSSDFEITRATQSVVEGDVSRNDRSLVTDSKSAINSLVPTFSIIFAAFFVFIFFRKDYQFYAERLTLHKSRSFIIGLLTCVLLPLVSLFLILTILGSVLGFGLLAAFLLLFIFALASLPLVVGVTIRKIYGKDFDIDFTTLLIGAGGVLFLTLIPVVGSFVLIIVFLISLGSIVHDLYQKIK